MEVHDSRGVVYTAAPDAVDDLTRIKGVGPVNNTKLNEVGIYRFQQIADWNEYNIWAFNKHLSFSGRIEREDWVSQAKALAAESGSAPASAPAAKQVSAEDAKLSPIELARKQGAFKG